MRSSVSRPGTSARVSRTPRGPWACRPPYSPPAGRTRPRLPRCAPWVRRSSRPEMTSTWPAVHPRRIPRSEGCICWSTATTPGSRPVPRPWPWKSPMVWTAGSCRSLRASGSGRQRIAGHRRGCVDAGSAPFVPGGGDAGRSRPGHDAEFPCGRRDRHRNGFDLRRRHRDTSVDTERCRADGRARRRHASRLRGRSPRSQAELTHELGITVEGAAAAPWAGLLAERRREAG